MFKGVDLKLTMVCNHKLKWCAQCHRLSVINSLHARSNIRFSNCISGKSGEAIDKMPVRLLRPCNIRGGFRGGGGGGEVSRVYPPPPPRKTYVIKNSRGGGGG